MAMDQTRANEVLTWMHGGAAPAALTAPIKVRLMTANGTTTANGTEVATGGGYTAVTGVTVTYAAAATASQATNAVAQVVNYPRVETVVGIEIWDATATAKRVEQGALASSKAMAAGDTLSFAVGAITSALA